MFARCNLGGADELSRGFAERLLRAPCLDPRHQASTSPTTTPEPTTSPISQRSLLPHCQQGCHGWTRDPNHQSHVLVHRLRVKLLTAAGSVWTGFFDGSLTKLIALPFVPFVPKSIHHAKVRAASSCRQTGRGAEAGQWSSDQWMTAGEDTSAEGRRQQQQQQQQKVEARTACHRRVPLPPPDGHWAQ